MLICSEFLESLVFFQICHFYAKKAANYLDDGPQIRSLMRNYFYIAFIVFTLLFVYQFWDQNLYEQDRSGLCHSFYFIIPSLVNQIVNSFFIYIGVRIMRTINEINSHHTALITPVTQPTALNVSASKESSSDTSHLQTANNTSVSDINFAPQTNDVEHRRKAARNMWLIIVTIFTIATYSSLYSVILFVWADSECYVQQ